MIPIEYISSILLSICTAAYFLLSFQVAIIPCAVARLCGLAQVKNFCSTLCFLLESKVGVQPYSNLRKLAVVLLAEESLDISTMTAVQDKLKVLAE